MGLLTRPSHVALQTSRDPSCRWHGRSMSGRRLLLDAWNTVPGAATTSGGGSSVAERERREDRKERKCNKLTIRHSFWAQADR